MLTWPNAEYLRASGVLVLDSGSNKRERCALSNRIPDYTDWTLRARDRLGGLNG
jgi:hypothetical protein